MAHKHEHFIQIFRQQKKIDFDQMICRHRSFTLALLMEYEPNRYLH